jgi:ATP-dependent DNA helicase RecG
MIQMITGKMSRIDIMTALGLKDEKHFRENYQQTGIATGVIEMTVPDKPKSRKQKYRLTNAGKKLLKGRKHE